MGKATLSQAPSQSSVIANTSSQSERTHGDDFQNHDSQYRDQDEASARRPHFSGVRVGFVVHSVILSVLLVIATSIVVALVVLQAIGEQVQQRIDRRLADGATLFQASMEDTRQDLFAVGTFFANDPVFIAAVRDNRTNTIEEKLRLASGVAAVDEADVLDTRGRIAAVGLTADRRGLLPSKVQAFASQVGFTRALGGDVSYGVTRGDTGAVRQEVFVPLRVDGGGEIVGILRLASILDNRDLQRFSAWTGLDVSLVYGTSRVATTLGRPDGSSLTDVAPDPSVLREVVDNGRDTYAWRDFPTGTVRAYYAPLTDPSGHRVGMLAVAIPTWAVTRAWQDAVIPILPVTGLVVIASGVLAYLLARRVREPVLALSNAAARLRSGDLATPIPAVAEVELTPLAEELERARQSVQERVEAMEAEEARQRALFAAFREPILIASSDGKIADHNAAAGHLFGGSPRLCGRYVADVMPFVNLGADGPERTLWQGAIEDAAGQSLEVEVSRITLAEGWRPAREVFVVHDISQYVELNRLREQLLYDVAHELRSPLSTLTNVLDILAGEYGELSTKDFDQLIGSARRTAARLHGLMEDLLNAGSIQAGRFAIRSQSVDLASIVEDAVEVVQPMAQIRQQRIVVESLDNSIDVLADRRYVRQVICNLLTNASKYGPSGEDLVIRAGIADGFVRVAVEDKGPGIPAEQRAGLFERFYRIRSAHEERGIGLGLAIAKGIVEAHGGTIGVESEVGRGTRVWFTLRRAGGTV